LSLLCWDLLKPLLFLLNFQSYLKGKLYNEIFGYVDPNMWMKENSNFGNIAYIALKTPKLLDPYYLRISWVFKSILIEMLPEAYSINWQTSFPLHSFIVQNMKVIQHPKALINSIPIQLRNSLINTKGEFRFPKLWRCIIKCNFRRILLWCLLNNSCKIWFIDHIHIAKSTSTKTNVFINNFKVKN